MRLWLIFPGVIIGTIGGEIYGYGAQNQWRWEIILIVGVVVGVQQISCRSVTDEIFARRSTSLAISVPSSLACLIVSILITVWVAKLACCWLA